MAEDRWRGINGCNAIYNTRIPLVDEYGGDDLPEPSTARRPEPMTLGGFAEFFLSASSLVSTLEGNYDDDLEQALGFFTVESDFYPGLERAFMNKVSKAFRK